MDRLKLTFSLIAISLFQFAFSQGNEVNGNNTVVKEKVYITTNSNTFLTGEKLYFAVTCLNTTKNTISEFSKIAYVELINDEKQVVFKNKLFLNNSKSNGEYFIPGTLKTGTYKLIAYTNWMLNENIIDSSILDITIINPYQPLDPKKVVVKNEVVSQPMTNNDANSAFNFEKKTYGKREKLMLRLKETPLIDKAGSYTLRVFKKDSLSNLTPQNTSLQTITKKSGTILIPEFRGEVIAGKIKPKKEVGAEIKNINIALSIVGDNSFFKIVKTNSQGEFAFTIESSYKTDKLQLQILDKENDEYTIEMANQDALDYSQLTFNPVTISPTMKKALENRSVASQIENAYLASKKDSLAVMSTPKIDYLKFDLEFKLDDYTRFQTLKETLTEVIFGAFYKTVGKRNEIHIVDNIKEYELSHPALVLIDGFYIQDVNELFKYNVDNVKSISLIRGGYYYGTKIFNGVIFIKSKNNDYENTNKNIYLIEPELLRPIQDKNYFSIDYSTNDYTRIPDYRYQLLWKPDVKQEENEIHFYTSDISGTFEIVLEGIDSKGNKILQSDSFVVE
ncbi:hypothetical protein [Flavobacterium sp. GCM10023249]|uniref:hypothetical protein n=1 Tax=unclassified Flavobacterium TaxID=196869 RepID=UPI0036113788